MACGRNLPQDRLLRLVRGADGRLAADPRRLAHGRGAYVCSAERCGAAIEDGRQIARALRASVTVEPQTLDLVREWRRSESTR
ncbi:MAG: YlxR family protein [Thermoleophilaceae bacterium]|nr:YlxR family protein [Thermoleophilaceae bacterium]